MTSYAADARYKHSQHPHYVKKTEHKDTDHHRYVSAPQDWFQSGDLGCDARPEKSGDEQQQQESLDMLLWLGA